MEEEPSLALSSENFSSLTLDISGLAVLAGSVQLFSDSACATPASDPVDADQAALSINANTLTGYGSFEFYAQHTDPTDEVGDCIGPVNYDFVSGLQNTPPTFSLHSENSAIMDSDPTPSFSLTSLEFESGKIQLFSDDACTTAASGEEDYSYSSSGATITANSLDGSGNYQYWAKITEGIENQSRCIGPVAYTMEALTLALSSPTSPLNSDSTPTFSVSGLVVENGTVQLFSDSTCTTAASATAAVSSATASITANALSAGSHQFYVQHTDTNSNDGDCFGPIAYTMETLTLALSSPTSPLNSDSTPTFSVSGLVIQNGNVQLFSDSSCTTAASSAVTVSSATASITANTLTTGSYQFYVQHTDSNSIKGDCTGSVTYTMEALTLALSSPTSPLNSDPTPTFSVSGLVVENGTVQLFSDSTCTTVASATATVSSATASITANTLTTGSYQFYVQHTDTNSNQGDCFGPVAYTMEALTLALSSPTSPLNSDSTPTFSVSGLVVHNGNIQLFSDSSCTTAASATVAVSSATASITANTLSAGSHQFYVQHTDTNSNKGDCTGPVAYTMEVLTLALSSPTSPLNSDPTPTFSVSGLVAHNGTVQLFSDSACTTAASGTVAVSSATASITANALSAGSYQFYVQHTDTNSNKGDCFGSVAYTMEALTLALSPPTSPLNSDSTPTFSVSGLVAHNGTVQLFSDSTCTTAASGTVAVSSAAASITANTLTTGSYQFYVQHTDSNSIKGDCFGPVAYTMEALTLAPSSPAISLVVNTTPTFNVSGLIVHNGTVQLFSDSACTTAASSTTAVSSATASITANALDTGSHQFYVQHIDTNSVKGDCTGPVAYTVEALTLALSSPNTPLGLDSTPTFSVSGLVVHNGTVQLFSDSSCTTAASATVAVSSGTASITANALSAGSHQFFVQHTDTSDNKGDCFGGISYRYYGIAISGGKLHTCALTSSGGVKCWGEGTYGQLGNDGTADTDHPVDVVDGDGSTTPLANIVQVSGGNFHTCALTSSGGVKCWGLGGNGQLGNDGTADTDHPVDVVDGDESATPLANIIQVSGGDLYTCALTSSGGVKCWGHGDGRLGNDGSTSTNHPVDVVDGDESTTPLANIVQISAGNYHTCALTSSGGVKCWGQGINGQLGNDGSTSTNHPVDVVDGDESTTPLANIVQISVGGYHTCALTSSGGVKCWGHGDYGQLGNDGTADTDHPVDVVDGDGSTTPLANIIQVSGGYLYTCALTSSGGVKCWGRGANGQLGNDGAADTDHPVDVVDGDGSTTPLANIVQVSGGNFHTCALTSSGGVKCWGDGDNGQLGNDGTDDTDHPVDVVASDGSSTLLDITP